MKENEHIGHKIRILQNQIHKLMEYKKEKNEHEDLTRMQRFIMGFLSKNEGKDIYQKDIETTFSISRATASNILKLMEQRGLIYRESVEHDARLKKLVLTEYAAQMVKQVEQGIRETEGLLTKGLSEEEIRQLHYYLDVMIQNVAGDEREDKTMA